MKRLLKLLLCLSITFSVHTAVSAGQIDKTIANFGINKDSVSISVKDTSTGKLVYKLNDKKSSMPASTLKLVTLGASIDTLGKDYNFSTKLYKNTNNELFLVLSADPFFSGTDLKSLIKKAKEKNITAPKNIYIDDYIFDSVEWGEGWQWDDDLNPLMPKFSSYNIDRNLLNIIFSPTSKNAPANIYVTEFYPTTFMNLVTTGDTTDIKLSRNNHISPDIINAEGTIKEQVTKQIPVNRPKRYFILRLEDAIRDQKMDYYGNFVQKKLPKTNIYLVAQVDHPITPAIKAILIDSDNFIAETVFKAAGAKFTNNTGSLKHSLQMLNAYLEKLKIDFSDVKIVDGSGVSKNNIVTADFMSEFLAKKAKDKDFVKSLPTAGEGTLENRMLYFRDNLHAKTGTLSDVSAIAGYITSRSGKTYAFDIMINDPKTKTGDKKSLEEHILRDIYAKY